jgi:hypothetical protein
MNSYLLIAACLIFLLGIFHSVLGEIKIFMRMKNAEELPVLRGIPLLWNRPDAARITIRMVWHLATVLAFCIATILTLLSLRSSLSENEVCFVKIIGSSMLLSFVLSLIVSKGSHMAWIFFLAIGMLCFIAVF